MAEEALQETKASPFMSSPESSSLESNGVGQTQPIYEDIHKPQRSVARRVIDSFKQDPHSRVTPDGVIGANGNVFNAEVAAQNTAHSPLARELKGRHLQMIAIGGSIGMAFISSLAILVLMLV